MDGWTDGRTKLIPFMIWSGMSWAGVHMSYRIDENLADF